MKGLARQAAHLLREIETFVLKQTHMLQLMWGFASTLLSAHTETFSRLLDPTLTERIVSSASICPHVDTGPSFQINIIALRGASRQGHYTASVVSTAESLVLLLPYDCSYQ